MQDAGYRSIPLLTRDGLVVAETLVDEADFAWLSRWAWRLSSGGYVRRGVTLGDWRDRRIVQLRMHREILGLLWNDPREGDHIDGNPLNNRRANLRVGGHGLNQQNRSGVEGAVPYRGVILDRARGKFIARATVRGKTHHLGRFDTAEEAAVVAAAFRAEHMPFARS